MGAEEAKRRRRGAELEEAILEAAWAEIVEHGYLNFAVDDVADRAETSKAVLYRRWPSKLELAQAAMTDALERDPVKLPDTGNLRDDVLAVLRQANHRRAGIAASALVAFAELHRDTGVSLEGLRAQLIDRRGNSLNRVVERAIERGEIDGSKVTDRIINLPFDLLRNELIMTLEPIPDAHIVEIVDTIFLRLLE